MFIELWFICDLFILVEKEVEDLFVELSESFKIFSILNLIVDDFINFLT